MIILNYVAFSCVYRNLRFVHGLTIEERTEHWLHFTRWLNCVIMFFELCFNSIVKIYDLTTLTKPL